MGILERKISRLFISFVLLVCKSIRTFVIDVITRGEFLCFKQISDCGVV